MDSEEHRLLLRQAVVEGGLDRQWSKAHKKAFFEGDTGDLEAIRLLYGEEVYTMAKNVSRSTYERYKRVFLKTSQMVLSGKAVFLTLTFTDEVLSKTSPETRRRYVSRALKAFSEVYVANVDYGAKKMREHYHAIVLFGGDGFKEVFQWPYGFFDAERVRTSEGDSKATSKYITKLSRHSMKDTGRAVRLIYSKRVVA